MTPTYRRRRVAPRGPKVVALGGGHGLSAALSALRHVTDQLTAVVTVADDGGSSGRLREEMDVIPPGDLRQALSALCDDADWGMLWRDVLQHRFTSSGTLNGHALGNLLIVTLWELLNDPVEGLAVVGELLGARGTVLPMSLTPLGIEAEVTFADLSREIVTGQHNLAITSGHVQRVWITPQNAPATPQAIAAIDDADWLILGPGSFYTSVMPHLLLPELREAILRSKAKRCLIMNLAPDGGEASDMTLADHVRALNAHVPELTIDVALADPHSAEDPHDLQEMVNGIGGILILRQLATVAHHDIHDPLRLAAALQDTIDNARGDISR